MYEIVVALAFIGIILAPCVVATRCASDRRALRRRDGNGCPAVERRDSR
jgi:hypothetical protein